MGGLGDAGGILEGRPAPPVDLTDVAPLQREHRDQIIAGMAVRDRQGGCRSFRKYGLVGLVVAEYDYKNRGVNVRQ